MVFCQITARVMNSTPTVFVVDPDVSSRDVVRELVCTMNLLCEEFGSGQEFLDAYTATQPGCVVLEVKIPDVNGLEIQERLNSSGAAIPVVFLAARATLSIAVQAMRSGALHFLEKPLREYELWDTVQEAIRFDRERREARAQHGGMEQSLKRLTPKERKVLAMIAQGKPKREMASELGVCVRTVELRRSKLMEKIKVATQAELLRFALTASSGPSPNGCAGCKAWMAARGQAVNYT